MLDIKDGREAVKLARTVTEHHVKHASLPSSKHAGVFTEKRGVFVTLHTYPEHALRGCIGIPEPVMTLREAIVESAKSATHDPRFPPLQEDEIEGVIIEVTILTKPERIPVQDPKEYISQIEIGRDGLIAEQGFTRGLLLPQVPVEQGWDIEEFLTHTCMKAGLLPDAWFDKATKIYKFSGQIFTELEPRGKIQEKNLDGSNN